jgi:DUF2934 family protein
VNQDSHKDLPAFIILSPKDIAARAYELYLQRGALDGFDHEDWWRAEQELRARAKAGRAVADAEGPCTVQHTRISAMPV